MEKRLGLYQKAVISNEEIMRQNRQGTPANFSSKTSGMLTKKAFVPAKDTVSFNGGASSGKIVDGFKKLSEGAKKFPEVFIKCIDTGFFAEFCALDFIGMIAPRTWQAFTRNTEELGHLNYKAGIEEAIREFLTGPSMFFIPMLMLKNSPKLFGAASSIELDTQKHFNNTLNEIIKKDSSNPTNLKQQFYDEILNEMFEKHNIQTVEYGNQKVNVKSFISENLHAIETRQAEYESKLAKLTFAEKTRYNYESTVYNFKDFMKKHVIDKFVAEETVKKTEELANKVKDAVEETPKTKDKISNELLDILEKIKTHGDNISGITSQVHEANGINLQKLGKIVVGKDSKEQPLEHAVSGLTEDLINYAKDVIKQVSEHTEDKVKLLEKIGNFKRGGRMIVSTVTLATTAAFLYCVPKLYQRNKQFPGIDGLTSNADGKVYNNSANTTKPNDKMTAFLNSSRRVS